VQKQQHDVPYLVKIRLEIVTDVTGFEKSVAEEKLTTLGFTVKTEEQFDNIIAEDFTEEEIELPSLVVMQYNEVIELAKTNGFTVKVTERKYDENAEKGEILSQN
jgi:beta-lactam-binding protein with PASTA domain